MRTAILWAVLAAGGAAAAGVGEQADGKALFNGKDLSGWTFRGGDKAAARSQWTVTGRVALDPKMPGRLLALAEGGGVLLNGGDGRGVDLISTAEHGDCELHIEFNVARGSKSGV